MPCSEEIHVEAAVLATRIVEQGAIGKVFQVQGMGPRRIGDPSTGPDRLSERARYGGVLTDIGSHNVKEMLTFSGSDDAEVLSTVIGNPESPRPKTSTRKSPHLPHRPTCASADRDPTESRPP